MRKLLLILLIIAVGISASMAQTIRTGVANNKSAAASVKPITTHQSLVAKPMKEFNAQMSKISPLALNQDVKVISSVTRGDKKIQIVQNTNGTLRKRVTLDNTAQKLNIKTKTPAFKSATDYTLFESFEDWDGSPDWTPAGWSRDNKTDLVTWDMSDGAFLCYPSDGDYMAYVEWIFPFDDDFNLITLYPRDEMLISPAFTPVKDEYLFFDVNYSAYFMFYDIFTDELDFENPVSNLQALISTDNGTNWTTLWDMAKDEGYTEDNIWDYTDYEWYTKMISLESYIGKSVKIAIRYTDRDGGNDVGLDNIAVREPSPNALYKRPQGFFIAGLTQGWSAYNLDLLVGHAYDQTIWRNLSTEAETYSWEFDNPDGSGSVLKSTEKNPDVPYPFDLYLIPTLTASGGNYSSTYQWGAEEMRFLLAGGEIDLLGLPGGTPSCGNYDLSLFETLYTYIDGKGGYNFGTNTDNLIEGVANYFEKPVHKYILDGVWAALRVFKGFPANTEFTMVIHKVVDGYLEDEIATATCTPADIITISDYAYTMPFKSFITIDPETGLEIENEYLEIEDAILIEIKGFNNIPGAEICFAVQEYDVDPAGENNAYIFHANGNLLSYPVSTSLLINLDLTYSFLLADSYEFIAPAAGGEKTFDVISLYSPDVWWLEDDLPEWLSAKYTFDEETWEIQLTLTADPLPSGTEKREAVVKIITYGADMSILVKQEKGTGIQVINVADTKVVNKNGNFELKYTSDYSLVSVYNVAGQKISGYSLPASGTFTVPAENYTKGVYLFSFSGTKGVSTVKVIK